MQLVYFLFVGMIIVPYLNASLIAIFAKNSNMHYPPLFLSLTWILVLLPIQMGDAARISLIMLDTLGANTMLLVSADLLAVATFEYRINLKIFSSLRMAILATSVVCMALYYGIFSLPEIIQQDDGPYGNGTSSADDAFSLEHAAHPDDFRVFKQIDSSNVVGTASLIIGIACGLSSSITTLIYLYVLKRRFNPLYDRAVTLSLIFATFLSAVVMKVVLPPWNIAAHRIVVQVIYFSSLFFRKKPEKIYFAPLQKQSAIYKGIYKTMNTSGNKLLPENEAEELNLFKRRCFRATSSL